MKKYRIIDWHIHTCASDGIYNLSDLVTALKQRNVQSFAITNHDTVKELEEAKKAAEQAGMYFRNGVEITTWYGSTLHLLYYDFKQEEISHLEEELRPMQEKRNEKTKGDLRKAQFNEQKWRHVNFEKIREKYSNTAYIGKSHVARVLVSAGYFDSIKAAIEAFKQESTPDTGDNTPLLDKTIEMLKKYSGKIVLAHMPRYEWGEAMERSNVMQLKEVGLQGIEICPKAYSKKYHASLEDMARHIRMAEELGLRLTFGSDFHGPDVDPDTEGALPGINLHYLADIPEIKDAGITIEMILEMLL